MRSKEVNLLIVDDDEVDVKALKRTFGKLKIGNPMYFARDGIEALEVLRGENGHKKIPAPYLILLDLNMPRMNGLEFLDAIRNDAELKTAIVFVFTTSADEKDRVRAYQRNVAGYILKSDPGRSFLESVELLEHYWKIVEFPS